MNNKKCKPRKKKLMRFSYKITISVLIVLIFFISFLTYITIERERSIITYHMNKEKMIITEMIARSVIYCHGMVTGDFKNELIKIVAKNKDIHFCRIVKSNGEIYLSNKEEEKGKIINNFALMRFMSSKIITQEYEGEQLNVVLSPVLMGYTVMLGYSLKRVQNDIFKMIMTNVAISIIIVMLIVIISFIIATKMITPIQELTKGAALIGEGNLGFRINVNTNDEIGILAESFNKMTEALQKTTVSKDYMDSVLNNMIDALFVTNADGKITMANKAACELLGFSYSELIGLTGRVIFARYESPFSGEGQREILSTGIIRNREAQLTNKNNSIVPVLFSASVIRSPDMIPESIICVAKDITEQKKAEEELMEMHKKLLSAAHQAGMGEIASGVLHNIGNILTSAGVSAETISYIVKRSKVPGLIQANKMLKAHENEIGEYLCNDPKGKLLPEYYVKVGDKLGMEYKILQDEIESLLEKISMIKNVVDTQQEYAFSSLYTEQINLISVIKDTLKIETSNFKKHNISLKTNFPENKEIMIMAQKTKVVDILVNCIKNAWEAMNHCDHEKILTITIAYTDNNKVKVEISDNGEGISEENIKKIFSFGFSTKDDGYGFGLHSCAIFMSEMGGSISAASNGPQKGTTFTLVFPLSTYIPGKNGEKQ